MKPVRIVTDSSAHLTPDEIERFGIRVVPMRLRIGRRIYQEGVELNIDSYARKLSAVKTLPRAQAPLLQEFVDVYHALSKETDQILSLHISGKLSNTVQMARTAAASLRGHTRITIIDSESISRGLGMVVIRAAEEAARGAALPDIARMVRGGRRERRADRRPMPHQGEGRLRDSLRRAACVLRPHHEARPDRRFRPQPA